MADYSSDWAQRIEHLEAGYEFMLAYAAQGQAHDDPSGEGSQIRAFLENMQEALDGLGESAEQVAKLNGLQDSESFVEALKDDAKKAHSGIVLVLGKPAISSQLVDNLNASIHLRTLLTDLFLLDEALK